LKLSKEIYRVLKHCKDFALRDQMQRSSVSIPSNIAEGYELQSNKNFISHLYISKGSSGELRTQLYLAIDQEYIESKKGAELILNAKKVSGMIQNFIKARKDKIRDAKKKTGK